MRPRCSSRTSLPTVSLRAVGEGRGASLPIFTRQIARHQGASSSVLAVYAQAAGRRLSSVEPGREMGKLTTATLSLAGVTVVCAGAIVICLQSGSRPRPRPRPRPEEDSDSDRPSPKPKPHNNNDDRRPSLAESVTSVVSDAFDASARIMVELGTGKRTTAKRRGSTSSVESVRTWRKSGKSKQQKNEPWARFIINEFHACLLGTDMRLLVEKHVLKEFRVLYDKEDCCATLRAVKFA